MYSSEDGAFLVKLARNAIESYLSRGDIVAPPRNISARLMENAGVFVTLETHPKKNLRGCIGYPEPKMPLAEATIRAAISAAAQDPRFPPVLKDEMKEMLVEVSILTPPKLVEAKSPEEYLAKIEIGRHGLIVEKGFNRGLLLPQVPVDQNWTKEEFLSHTCVKAGLRQNCWREAGTKIYEFSGIVFSETSPKGKVEEKIRLKY